MGASQERCQALNRKGHAALRNPSLESLMGNFMQSRAMSEQQILPFKNRSCAFELHQWDRSRPQFDFDEAMSAGSRQDGRQSSGSTQKRANCTYVRSLRDGIPNIRGEPMSADPTETARLSLHSHPRPLNITTNKDAWAQT